ncbi:MAG: hypothetical protein UX71_C0001G0031 [Parcubacteria group bacterium GW2011_GWA1_47_10]|nr:MAG: hypothetical protein UX71_C0001G0031 [Parcubacteria group bacterium GW2011_GWA1_47_10]
MLNPIEMATAAVEEGKKVLILGVLPQALKEWRDVDPLLEIWSVDNNNHHRNIPANTGLVLLTQNVHHGTAEHLRPKLPAGVAFCQRPLKLSEVRELLEEVWRPRIEARKTKKKTNEDKAVTATPAAPSADAAKFLANFVICLPTAQTAIEAILKQNDNLLQENADLRGTLEAGKDQALELQTTATELDRVYGVVDDLRKQLDVSEVRAATAETELAEKNAAVMKLFGRPPA